MAESANIASIDAIVAFRAALIVFLSKARPVLDEISAEVLRVRQWLENDRTNFWQNEMRLRSRKLEEARNELFNATLSQSKASTSLHLMNVQRAERLVREAEGKLSVINKWSRELENRTEPLTKQLEQVQSFIVADMTRAVAHLDQVIRAVEAYAQTRKEPV